MFPLMAPIIRKAATIPINIAVYFEFTPIGVWVNLRNSHMLSEYADRVRDIF